jgi:putative glutamine amidotransferase
MPPRIAIPMPHSTDREYAERAIPQYERAVMIAGGQPVRIPLDVVSAEVRSLIESCNGVLLPGSNADINPKRFQQEKSPRMAPPDLRREGVDDLLLEYAYAHRKPVLGICYGLQSLNVFRGGSLIQHIPDFLPEELRSKVNHEAGGKVPVAHTVEISNDTFLAAVICGDSRPRLSGRAKLSGSEYAQNSLMLPVNSSHHQSAEIIGNGLRLAAHCPDDGITEALEGTSPDHFVIAVQWHPERSVDDDDQSKSIFRALVDAAR